MAKDNRTRVEYRNISYHIERPAKTQCPDDGKFKDLKSRKCCGTFTNTEVTVYNPFKNIAEDYHVFLKKKTVSDDNW